MENSCVTCLVLRRHQQLIIFTLTVGVDVGASGCACTAYIENQLSTGPMGPQSAQWQRYWMALPPIPDFMKSETHDPLASLGWEIHEK